MNINKGGQLLLIAVGIMALSGCASNYSPEGLAKSDVAAEKIRTEAAEKLKANKKEDRLNYLESVPEWALNARKADSVGVYAVGIAESDDLYVSIQKSLLRGQYGLAVAFEQEITGSERSIIDASEQSIQNDGYVQLIDKLVASVPLIGFETLQRKVIVNNDGGYSSFVLLRLPYHELNRVLSEERKKARDNKSKLYFDELEQRLEQRRINILREQERIDTLHEMDYEPPSYDEVVSG